MVWNYSHSRNSGGVLFADFGFSELRVGIPSAVTVPITGFLPDTVFGVVFLQLLQGLQAGRQNLLLSGRQSRGHDEVSNEAFVCTIASPYCNASVVYVTRPCNVYRVYVDS